MRNLFSDRFFQAAMVLSAALVVGLQVYGGAYQGEFNSHADESAHFVSALLVRDYLGQWPPPDPLPWAVQYYIHYPKVALGHWPPGYYVVQALWWLILPVSRASALWLNIAMALAGMAIFHLLARRIRPGWPAVVVGALMLCTRVVQESYAMVLSDLPSLVAALAVLWLLTRLLEQPDTRRLLGVAAALAMTMAIKGTGAVLLGAPVLALVACGAGKRVWIRWAALVLASFGIPVAGLLFWQYHGSIEAMGRWAGLGSRIPWGIGLLPELAGAGCLILAAAGLGLVYRGRQPAGIAAGAVLISMIVISYYVRAMREPRHWIAAVPALLLLNLIVYAWLEQRWPRQAPVVALAALFWFPLSVYHQQPEGFRALAAQLRLPARMLVSSTLGWSEGSWIAIIALGEARPQSTIVRATKLLAESDWNGYRYKILASTSEDIERSLDETAIDIVVLHNSPQGDLTRMPHHPLLQGHVRDSRSWRPCAKAGTLEAYCRTLPPRFPRKPIRIDLRSRLGFEIEER